MSDSNDYEVLMSPLLCNKLDIIDNKINTLLLNYQEMHNKMNKVLDILANNSKKWELNKDEYIKLLEDNKNLSEHNMATLNKNRGLYLDKLDNLNSNHMMDQARSYNHYWRTSGTNTVMKPSESSVKDILFPWFASSNKNDNT